MLEPDKIEDLIMRSPNTPVHSFLRNSRDGFLNEMWEVGINEGENQNLKREEMEERYKG